LGTTNSQSALLTVTLRAPVIVTEPQSQAVLESSNAMFSVSATGTAPLAYQWQFNGTNLAGATDSSLILTNVLSAQAGTYAVIVTNAAGVTNSDPATLTVYATVPPNSILTYLTYNVKGNGAVSWSTNAAQVQAVGREVMFLQPDVITFNEIPDQFTYEMTNFVRAFLPGYYLATNSASDGFIRSVIASRFPILSSQSHLHSADLNPYGYTNSNFTRDLFEAQIAVPGFAQPVHVFAVHLKSGQATDESSKRTAEAGAISNYFVNVFLPTNNFHTYTLSGDMNEDINDPPSSNPQSIQKLVSAPTGLKLTTPVNPVTGSALTFSIQSVGGLTKRYDYIMPSGLLFSNIYSSQVFRTDLLTNPPPPLLTNDDKTASDHLPVLMLFRNPYDKPFHLTSVQRSNATVSLGWESVPGQGYRVEGSSNLTQWAVIANGLMATGATFSFSTNVAAPVQFFRVYRVP
jgi:endonuclease/exonuclease/phosphatase family metal-dependent hydrolase